ncbi:MAG: YggT family protein [Cyanobacteria bacterium]|nr:YggT family protein [Cyanobacteriota bacterium]
MYSWILMGRILLSWVLGYGDWEKPPWSWVYVITEPVLAPFRRLIPPLGMIDISPIILFFALSLLEGLISAL